MLFSSITFLTVFLPLTVLLYYLPKAFISAGNENNAYRVYKNLLLLSASLIFYAWGEPRNIILMLLSIIFNYTAALHLERLDGEKAKRKALFIFTVLFNVGLLVFFKYSTMLCETFCLLSGTEVSFNEPALPIGISFYTFQIMSYVIDVYRKKSAVQRNLSDFALYISMFPQLIAGPIVQYNEIERSLSEREEGFDTAAEGIFEFIKGLAKKTILANRAGAVYEYIIADGVGEMSLVSSWTAIIFYAFQIYFDFSGYSDMARGLGGMFGFSFPKNFNHPYMATDITDFWRRWHKTLSSWFRDYVYIPLGGNRCSKSRQVFNLFIVWSLTGLWHGASWNYLLWGIYYFILLVLEKNFYGKLLDRMPLFFRRLVTFILVLFGWVLFATEDLSAIGGFFGSLFGVNGLLGENSLYVLFSNFALLIIMAVFSTDIFTLKEENKKKISVTVLRFVSYALLFAVSIIYLLADAYNPFLYFRF